LSASLDDLGADLLAKGSHKYDILAQGSISKTGDVFHKAKFDIAKQKNVFPYELAKSPNEMRKIVDIPSRDDFYSTLSEKKPSETDYERAAYAWSLYEVPHLGEFAKVYCLIGRIFFVVFFARITLLFFRCICFG
jgi:hypothetical protein